ncbi:MAG: fimbrillin family protein [Alistipes sp.]|nr:fimbrillin family protein [Alistipes sp.]
MKKLFFSLLAVAAMASCSKSELSERPVVCPEASDVEILASSNAKGITTRTPFENPISATNLFTAQVLVSLTSGDYSTLWNDADDQMEFTNSTDSIGFKTTASYYPADGSTVYLSGFYPSTGWTESPDGKRSYVNYSIDGKTDVMAAKEVSGDKAKAQDEDELAPKLEFEHLLTQLVVKVEAADSAAYKAWGEITDMYLIKAAGHTTNERAIFPQVRVTPGTAATTCRVDDDANYLTSLPCFGIDATDGATDIEFGKDASDAAAPVKLPVLEDDEEPVAVAYTLVTPVTATEKHYTLVIKTKNHTNEYVIPVTLKTADATPAVFTAATTGYAFDVVLTFSATEILAKATVADWKEGGVTEIPVQ